MRALHFVAAAAMLVASVPASANDLSRADIDKLPMTPAEKSAPFHLGKEVTVKGETWAMINLITARGAVITLRCTYDDSLKTEVCRSRTARHPRSEPTTVGSVLR